MQTHSLEFLEDSFPFIYSVASFGNPSHVLVELAFLLFCFPSLCLFMPFLEGFSHNTCVEIFTFFIFERCSVLRVSYVYVALFLFCECNLFSWLSEDIIVVYLF